MNWFSRSFLVIAAFAIVPHADGAIQWQVDYTAAHAMSQKQDRPLLLFFSGSDWSGRSMQLKREVLSSAPFEEKIEGRFICMEADFPKHSALPEKSAKQYQELKDRFHIREMPTVLLLDPQERVIAQMGYLPESGAQLADDLIHLVELDTVLVAGLKHLESDPAKLKELYQMAQELGRPSDLNLIIEAGIKTNDPYFCLEKYRQLVDAGEMHASQTEALRASIVALDPENQQGVHFTLALIDFQELCQSTDDLDAAVAPLLSYLARFGASDAENVWRVEMMIAQHYMNGDAEEKAIVHAENALKAAPEAMHTEIAHSLDYIRSTSAHK